jgi:hypothetical protein
MPGRYPTRFRSAARALFASSVLFLVALTLLEVHLDRAAVHTRADRSFVFSGAAPVGLVGDGRDTWCFVDDEFRSVPNGTPPSNSAGPSMLRLPSDGVRRQILCSDDALLIESRFLALHPLVGARWPFAVAALLCAVGLYSGWPLRRPVPDGAIRGLSGSSPRRATSRRRAASRAPPTLRCGSRPSAHHAWPCTWAHIRVPR